MARAAKRGTTSGFEHSKPDFRFAGDGYYLANPGALTEEDELPGMWLFSFGAYGGTRVVVWKDSYGQTSSLEDALEEVADFLAENAPGHLTSEEEMWSKENIRDAMKDLELAGAFDDLSESDQEAVRESIETDMTYTESGWLTSWEWGVSDQVDPKFYRAAWKESWDLYEKEEDGLTDDELENYEKQSAEIEKRGTRRNVGRAQMRRLMR